MWWNRDKCNIDSDRLIFFFFKKKEKWIMQVKADGGKPQTTVGLPASQTRWGKGKTQMLDAFGKENKKETNKEIYR